MLKVETRKLHLAHTWTIARSSSDYKENVFVQIVKDGIIGIGEAAPNIRYDEDAERTTQKIAGCTKFLPRITGKTSSKRIWLKNLGLQSRTSKKFRLLLRSG